MPPLQAPLAHILEELTREEGRPRSAAPTISRDRLVQAVQLQTNRTCAGPFKTINYPGDFTVTN